MEEKAGQAGQGCDAGSKERDAVVKGGKTAGHGEETGEEKVIRVG